VRRRLGRERADARVLLFAEERAFRWSRAFELAHFRFRQPRLRFTERSKIGLGRRTLGESLDSGRQVAA